MIFLLVAEAVAGATGGEAGQVEPQRGSWKNAGLPASALFAVAVAVSVLSTASPAQTFRWSPRIGFHEEETGPGGRFRWTRRRFALWLVPEEVRRLSLAHFSPTTEPVELTAKVSGRPAYRRSLKPGESITLALAGSPGGPRAVIFEVSRAFVPKRLGVSQDRRELG